MLYRTDYRAETPAACSRASLSPRAPCRAPGGAPSVRVTPSRRTVIAHIAGIDIIAGRSVRPEPTRCRRNGRRVLPARSLIRASEQGFGMSPEPLLVGRLCHLSAPVKADQPLMGLEIDKAQLPAIHHQKHRGRGHSGSFVAVGWFCDRLSTAQQLLQRCRCSSLTADQRPPSSAVRYRRMP